jgi:hypothetical protein
MELNKIERLVEKYFDGETSVEEETYFASTDVASHLMQYKSILSIYLMRLRRSTNKNLQRYKAAVKNVLSYGYQLLLQFCALDRWDVCVC